MGNVMTDEEERAWWDEAAPNDDSLFIGNDLVLLAEFLVDEEGWSGLDLLNVLQKPHAYRDELADALDWYEGKVGE